MTMLRKTIALPEAMEHWIKARIASGRYVNNSEYLRDLIRRDQERHASEEELRGLIREGLDSGVSDASPEAIKTRVRRRLKADGRL